MSGQDLSIGPVGRRLPGPAAPMTPGILAAMSVALVDACFLGRLGTEELAAISFIFPVVFTVTGLSIGLGAGTASVVSRAIGEGDRGEVRRLSTDALALAVLMVAALSALGWLTIRPLFARLGAEGAVLEHVVGHMRIWSLGMPFLLVPMVSSNILRGRRRARAARRHDRRGRLQRARPAADLRPLGPAGARGRGRGLSLGDRARSPARSRARSRSAS